MYSIFWWLVFFPYVWFISLLNIPPFFILAVKVLIVVYLIIYIRATLPRYRYDQLMSLGWLYFLPLSISWFILSTIFLLY